MSSPKYKRCACEPRSTDASRKAEGVAPTQELPKLLKVAAVPSRLKLLFLLQGHPHCVCDLVTHTNLSQTLISHHLADIVETGLARSKKSEGFTEYFLTPKGRTFVSFLSELAH